MFSTRQKREIADRVQEVLRATKHPELPSNEIQFNLHVFGEEIWSWADISNNAATPRPKTTLWNERTEIGKEQNESSTLL